MYNWLELEDTLLRYEYIRSDREDAPTLVLTHGNGFDLTQWDEVVQLLRNDYHILRYDFRNQGRSDSDSTQLTWEILIHDFEKLLSYLSIKDIHLVGYSMGGNFAIELARRQKSYLKSMVLISTAIYIPKNIAIQEIKRRNSWVEEEVFRNNIYHLIQNLCHPAHDDKINRIKRMYDQVEQRTYIDYFNLCADTAIDYDFEEFHQLRVPTLFLAGEFDPLYPPRLQMVYHHYFPNNRIFVVPQASNAVMIDQPEVFSEHIRLFIDQSYEVNSGHTYNYTEQLNRELDEMFEAGIRQRNEILYLELMNDFKLVIDGKVVEGKWSQRKSMQLMTYIILNKSVTREQLCETFWPDEDITKARSQLSVALNHIKRMVERSANKPFDNYLDIKRDVIELKVNPKIDLFELMNQIRQLEKIDDIGVRLKNALSLFNSLPKNFNRLIYDDWFVQIIVDIENRILDICNVLLQYTSTKKERADLLKIMVRYNAVDFEYIEELINILKDVKSKEVEYYRKKALDVYK
ncbi:alpha/beta hydrolase [Aquisalibacillus elongatus]|uniref:Pimeloyl-ACP methyl ester carboxylesterase n=1 Tax=Aquisalibacillus elongatus TaxID=485577 RepID=A0A3N5B6P8_9BACI|nr:alpha/beta hydrolase [Aquisalibacillus elongatus]RPF53366.1 pimeloyl-ACP methyl ester carboxylesterase [Aquisalibacillus elongatus]